MLAGGFVAGVGGGAGERGIDAIEQLFARSAAVVEGAGFHQMLEHSLVNRATVDPLHEIVEIGVRPILLALGDDLLGGELADAFHAGEAKANGGGGGVAAR
jgi:hypothetical protein